MSNTEIKTKYFWIDINPPYCDDKKEWRSIRSKLEEFCYNFTCLLNISEDNLIPIKFKFYIEKEIEFYKQKDYISTSNAFGIPKQVQLTINIDYKIFDESDDKTKFQILLNGILYLLEFWKINLKIPKNVKLEELINCFRVYLKEQNQYLDINNLESVYIKSNNNFRITFDNHIFKDIEEKEIFVDFENIENYLNNNLHNTSYGKSVREIFFSYDIFDFYSPKKDEYKDNNKDFLYGRNKDLSIMEQFDTNYLLYLESKEQFEYFKEGILNAILRIKEMKRKPKFFDVDKLYIDLKKLLDEYTKLPIT